MQDLGIEVLFQGKNLFRLLEGLWVTVRISIISVLISIVLGIVLGMIMTMRNPFIKIITRCYLEFVRIMPQLVLLFLIYFGLTKMFQINLSGELSAVIVFVLWGTAEMGDLVRGALTSIPKHQYESGKAIGLTVVQNYLYIIIPQTIRRLLPQAINLVTRMIKTTSLIALIGVVEVVKVGQQIIEASRLTTPSAAIWIYGVIFFLYFIVCYPISILSTRLEKHWRN
ncbi:MAG: amino acid transporter permease [Herbinix sp.]|jgi:polar amino acid transport system permease protein|nr:amino acid transporter permease [Herbinix sp.]